MSHLRHVTAKILQLAVTADESDDSFAVTSVTFYFGRQKQIASDGWSVPFSGGAAVVGGATELELGSVIPPPTIIRLVPTFQA